MTLKLDRFASLFVCGIAGFAMFAVGCGSKGVQGYNDGSIKFDSKADGTGTAGTTGTAGSTGTMSDAGADLLPPLSGDGSRLVVAGQSFELVGSGNDSCTNQVPYSTDRWCAFAKPATSLGNFELWVINATAAAAGTAIKCNTTDPNCLRLTSGLLDDSNFHFRIHRFDGDSLIFSEGVSGQASGDIFGWRPGWTAPRKLSSQSGALCLGNKQSTTALCVDNVTIDPTMTMKTLDLRAGTLDDPNGGLMPLVDTVIWTTKNDSQDDLQRYEWDISPDGRYIAWSGRYDIAGLETLKIQKVGDDTSRKTVATDVSAWTISDDLTRWYWLKSFNYNGLGTASGSLESAPFPAGTPSKSLVAKVGDYFQAGKSKGLLVRSNLTPDPTTMQGVGTLTLMADRDAPGALQMLDTSVLTIFDKSADGTKVMYGKTESLLGQVLPVFDLFVAKADGSPVCTLASSPIAFADPSPPKFLSSGSLAVFGRINGVTGEGEGLYVNVAMCKATKFATEIYAWQGIGDEGYVYSDDLTAVSQHGETTLRFAQATNGSLPAAGGTKIQTRAGLQFAPLLPALDSVMYTIGSGTTADGLYINTKLPFMTVPPVAAPDGGVTTTDAGDAAIAEGGLDTGASTDGGSDTVTAETGGGIDALGLE
jgi:hypothetical protein